jgi:hypothetical protein
MSEVKQEHIVKENEFKKQFEGDNFWERAKSIDSKTILEELS